MADEYPGKIMLTYITDENKSNKVTIKIKLWNNTLINAVIHRKLSKLNQGKNT